MLRLRSLPFLAALCLACSSCDDSGAEDSTNGDTATASTITSGVTSTMGSATTTPGPSTTAVVTTSNAAVSNAAVSNAAVTSGTGAGGASSGSTGDTATGSTTAGGANTQSASTGQGGGGGGGAATPRTECPTAPPAMQKDPASDRNLAVSKETYAAMLTQEAPFEGTRGQLPWHLYAPAQATENPNQRFPLLVVLHGGYGREVTDGNIMVDVAQYLLGSQNGLLTEANLAEFPTYIVLPHCRVEEGCTFGSNEWASAGGAHYQIQEQPSVAGGTALELVEHVIDTYAVDPTRVYLTGNSMGGGGTWEFASRRPELFAAVLPVSGHPPALEFLTPIADAKLPVWAFGAQNDTTNPYADTVEAIDEIDSAGGCAWLTTYNGAGHDDALWSSPYLEPGLWSWLFAQTNSSAPR